MMDIINPWGALRRAKARIADLEADIDSILTEARRAIVKRERLAAQLRLADLELSSLTQRYRDEAKIWITSPVMLRHAVEARIGKKLAA